MCFVLQGLVTYWGENMSPKITNLGYNRKHNQSSTNNCKDLDNSSTSIKTFSKYVEGCRDGRAKNHRN